MKTDLIAQLYINDLQIWDTLCVEKVRSQIQINTVCHIIYLLFSGTWYVILTFVNFCGVVSNAFLIAYTSAWGANYDSEGKL